MDAFLLLVAILIPSSSEASLGLKVPSLLPEGIESCLLRKINLSPTGLKTVCSAICQSEPSCLLACRIGSECWLYKAAVSPNWSQSTPEVPQKEIGTCFSFWAEKRDIAPSTYFTASSNFSSTENVNGINDGFSCPLYNRLSYFSSYETMAWVLGDLSSPKWVQRVVIQLRGNINNENWETFFANVEVRVGNGKGTGGDFSNNKLMNSYTGSDFDYVDIVTFKGEGPLFGRYVSVQRVSGEKLGFMEMKIIEAP